MRQKYERLSEEVKSTLRRLTLEGRSLNALSKITGLGKTTIYYQVKSLKPRQWRKMEINISEFEIGELIGAFAGDGNYYHRKYEPNGNQDSRYRIRYFLSLISDKNYANYLIYLLKRLNLNPGKSVREKENTICVNVNSKEFSEFIKKYLMWEDDKTFSIRLKKEINNYSYDFLRGFARGLMDTDGFLNDGNAACACISKRLIDSLGDIFTMFQITHSRRSLQPPGKNRRMLFYARVLKAGLLNYKKHIGFSSDYKRDKLISILNRMGSAGFEPTPRSRLQFTTTGLIDPNLGS